MKFSNWHGGKNRIETNPVIGISICRHIIIPAIRIIGNAFERLKPGVVSSWVVWHKVQNQLQPLTTDWWWQCLFLIISHSCDVYVWLCVCVCDYVCVCVKVCWCDCDRFMKQVIILNRIKLKFSLILKFSLNSQNVHHNRFHVEDNRLRLRLSELVELDAADINFGPRGPYVISIW